MFGSPKNTEGYQFSKTFFGVIFANNPNLEESLPIKHAAPLQDAGVTARRPLDFTASRPVCRLTQVPKGRGAKRGELRGAARARAGRGGAPGGALVGAHMCCLVLANAWVIWAGRRHERRSSAGVFYHPGPMAGAAAGMPKVVQVLDVINSDVDELDLRLGITEDGDMVFGVREAVQRARGVQKSKANEALAGKASENLARALGIAGGIFDTARWPGSVNAQDTCEVQHIAKVLDWALENYHGAKGLTVDKRVALVADVRAKLVPHAQQRISGVRGRMAAS